jgi:hypothetical protein
MSWAPVSFCVAAALLAAAVGDPVLETLARTGAFGPNFGDDDQLGAIPAVLCAVLVAGAIVVRRVLHACGTRSDGRALLLAFGRARPNEPLRHVPAIAALTLAAVYGIEALELRLGGSAHAGLSWLGAPLALALVAYVALSALAALAVDALLRALVATLTALVREAIALVAFLNRAGAGSLDRGRARTLTRARSAIVARRARGRAPPSLPRPA